MDGKPIIVVVQEIIGYSYGVFVLAVIIWAVLS